MNDYLLLSLLLLLPLLEVGHLSHLQAGAARTTGSNLRRLKRQNCSLSLPLRSVSFIFFSHHSSCSGHNWTRQNKQTNQQTDE